MYVLIQCTCIPLPPPPPPPPPPPLPPPPQDTIVKQNLIRTIDLIGRSVVLITSNQWSSHLVIMVTL